MRTTVCMAAVISACSGCVSAPPQPVISSGVDTTVSADDPNCREYTRGAVIDGQEQQLVGRACLQSDGTWKIVEGTSEHSAQIVTVYTPPPYAAYPYPYYDPWPWSSPFGLGIGASFVFFNGHHHGFHHHGFHRDHGGGHHHGRMATGMHRFDGSHHR
jgi:hypothetical protein